MNKIIMVGNTTKETDTKEKIAKTSIAVKRDFKNANGEYESDFFDLVAFQHQAEYMTKYVHKGDKIAIAGKLQTRQYEAQDGTKRKVYEIVVESIENLSPKATETKQEEIEEDADFTETDIDMDDVPF